MRFLDIMEKETEYVPYSIANRIFDIVDIGDRSSRLTFSTNMISIHLLNGLWFIYIHVNMIYMMSLAHLLCSEIIDILHKPLIPFEIMTFCDFSTLWRKRQNVSLIPHPTKSLI